MLGLYILGIILLLLVGMCAYAGHFFINAGLFRDSTWFKKKGHQMMNPDNFNTVKTKYDDIEARQNAEAHVFWEDELTLEHYIQFNGDTLYAREYRIVPRTDKWVIAVHGYRSTGKRDMAFPAMTFSKAGYNVLVPDLRSHGKSTGNVIGMGWLDRLDIEEWIRHLVEKHPSADITLFGGSMGAATIMMASGDELPKQVTSIIADCGYSSVYDEFKEMLTSAMHLPAGPILFFADVFAKKRVGFSLKEASCLTQLKKNTLPALFIHGTGDKFVPHKMIYENLEATKGVKESLLIEKAPHLSSWIYDESAYFDTVFQFLNTIESEKK